MLTKLKGSAVNKAMSFAHLAGFASKASAEFNDETKEESKAKAEDDEKRDQWAKMAEENPDREQAEDESDDDYKARMEDMDKEEEAEGDDPEKEDEPKSSKAKSEDESEDDEDSEMRGNSTAAKARLREQKRCAAIFASPSAAKNPTLAANLAFKTRMTRSEALAVLEATPAAVARQSRSASNPRLSTSGGFAQTQPQANASRWDAAFAKANPNRK